MSLPAGAERRRYYRLRYPPEDTARIRIAGRGYELNEVSERGIRFKLQNITGVKAGQPVTAYVELRSGHRVEVSGVVLRYDNSLKELILHLTVRGIPAAVMYDEQRYLIQHHPDYLQRRYYRLRYPPDVPAHVKVAGQAYELAEVSEGGIRFKAHNGNDFKIGQQVTAVLEMQVGYRVEVKGFILRYEKAMKEYVLILNICGIPAPVMLDEYRYLVNKYPNLKQT